MSNKTVSIAIAATLLALSLVGIIILIALYEVASNVDFQRSVVVDAGSTSSKLNLYEWKDEPFRTNGRVEQVKEIKVQPGISAHISDPFNAYPEIEPKLKELVANLSESDRQKIPIYLAATAGMRLTLLDDPLGSMDVFEALRRGLQTSGFQVETPNERIRLLSGPEEGLYGWVSVNAILKLITEEKQVLPSETVGSLDLGGASTQIAFSPKNKTSKLAGSIDYTSLKLYGAKYDVYSHSFLCYGKNEFERRTKASIIGESAGPKIDNPCWHHGNTFTDKPDDIYNGPCISGSYADKVFTEKLQRPAGLNTLTFVGTGDPEACNKRVRAQFNTSLCLQPPCSFNNIHQPEAYAGFSFVMKHLFPNKVTGFTQKEVKDEVYKFCRTEWNLLQTDLHNDTLKFAAKFCFDGIYVLALLDNYGFKTDAQWKSITFGQKIDGKSVSWAFGYMLDQSGHLPTESPKINLPLATFVPVLMLFVTIFLVSLILLFLLLLGKL